VDLWRRREEWREGNEEWSERAEISLEHFPVQDRRYLFSADFANSLPRCAIEIHFRISLSYLFLRISPCCSESFTD
jgi:hypothetical protein